MNLKKINKMIVDAMMKEDPGLKVGKHDDKIGITIGGVWLVLIDAEKFIFDKEKIKNELNISPLISSYHHNEAVKTNEVKILDCGQVQKIENNDGYAWVKPKDLELFNKDCTFKIKDKMSPVYIYEKEELVGLVMPIRMKEGE